MYHRSAMFEVASDADQRRLGVPEGDPRYATDFLPRMDGAGCPGGGGALGSLMAALAAPLQELRTPELAGLRWPTRRRFDPSSSPSAKDTAACISPSMNKLRISL